MSNNNFFEHQVIPQNAATSPVENLASEVSEAFDKVSIALGTDTIYPSLNKVLGNFVLTDLAYHGFSQVRSDTFSINSDTKDLSLSYIPTSAISLSYIDTTTDKEVFLTQKQPTQELTNKTDFKVLGRVIVLAGSFVGVTLKANYTGIEPDFAGKNVKPNVLKNTNGTYLQPLSEVDSNTFEISYDINLQSLFSKYFNVALDSGLIYLIAKENGHYSQLSYDSVSISNNKITFVIDEGLDKDYNEVLVYVLNVTVADLLDSLYKEVLEHKHTKEGSSKPIDHKNILNNYQNTSRIFYKDSETPNYNHPQFLNREGYNPSVTAAYENGMLGDLFLASVISDGDQTFKSLTKNSVKLLFGDPVAGSKLYFDNSLRSLNLLSGANLNGLNITAGNGFKALSVNNNTYIMEVNTYTALRGKNNTIRIVDDGTSDAQLETKHFRSTGTATLNEVGANQIVLGNTRISTDGVDTTFDVIDSGVASKYKYDSKTSYKDIEVEDGVIHKVKLDNAIYTDAENSLTNSDDNFEFVLKDKVVKVTQNSGRSSGFSVGTSTKARKIYSADFLGQIGSSIDTSFYIETPKDSETFYLHSTDEPISINGVTYVYQKDVDGAIRIDNLKDWRRATLNFGVTTAYKLTLNVSDQLSRNGLKIGETRISVIGPQLDCPEGATIFESKDTIHFVKPLGDADVDCNSVNYQSVNLGTLQVLGDAAFAEGATIVGNLIVGESSTVNSLVVNTITNLQELTVSGETTFSGANTFIGSVSIANNVDVTGAIDLTGSLSASDGNFNKFVNVGDTLTVGGQAIFSDNVIVQGSLHTTENFTTNGNISAGNITAGDAKLGSINAQGAITAIGSLTAEGPATFKGNIDAAGNLAIKGNIDSSGEVTADSLYITSDTTLMGRFVVDGPVTINSDSVSIGSTQSSILLTGTLQVTGARSVFSGDMNVQGELVASSTVRMNDKLVVAGQTETVSLKVGSTAVIGGNLMADAGEFTRKVYFQDGLKTMGASELTTVTADSGTILKLNTDELYIRNVLSMGPDAKITAYQIEVSEFNQKDPVGYAQFAGEAKFQSTAFFNDKIIVGNSDIEFKRSTSGCLITDNQIKLGNNSTIEAIKFFAGKGTPAGGNRDLNAGYCFASSFVDSGVDGDTGLFAVTATDNDGSVSYADLDGSNLEIWIDGARKYVFFKREIAFNEPDANRYGLAVVTLEMLQRAMSHLESKISAAAMSMNAATWPIGSIYITTNSANPYNLFKFGYWVRFAPGRTLVGRVVGDTQEQGGQIEGDLEKPADWSMNTVRATYGDFSRVLKKENLPSEGFITRTAGNHGARNHGGGGTGYASAGAREFVGIDKSETGWNSVPFNNVQPSIIVNMWERQS